VTGPGFCVTCQPTVEHHAMRGFSIARCWICGRVAAPVTWGETMLPPGHLPPDITTRALDQFRAEFHHAD
jgi:hypothetical protein